MNFVLDSSSRFMVGLPHSNRGVEQMSITIGQLEQQGFDASIEVSGGSIRVRCSQCEAMVINGVACHERGCPNETHECFECETLIPKRQRYCEDCAENLY